jgi:hypothetical protein
MKIKIKNQYTLKELCKLVRSKTCKDGKIQVLASTAYGYENDYYIVEDVAGLTKKQWEEFGDSLCDDWEDVKNDWFLCIDGTYYSYDKSIRNIKVVEEKVIKIKY